MSLTKCLEEIKKVKPVAEEDVEGGSVHTLPARRGRKKAAAERLKELRSEYAKELGKSSMYIVAVGDKAQDLATAIEPFAGFINDPEEFYTDLAGRISPELYAGKPTVSNLFDVMGRHLEDKMNELGVYAYPQMIMKTAYGRLIKDAKDFAVLVKEAVNEQVGAEVVGIQAAASTVDRAIERGHEGSTTLMVLPTQDETLAKALAKDLHRLTPNVFVVGAGKVPKALKDMATVAIAKVSDDTLQIVLKSIKNLRK